MSFKFWFTFVMTVLLMNALWPMIPEGERIWAVIWAGSLIAGIGTYDIWQRR